MPPISSLAKGYQVEKREHALAKVLLDLLPDSQSGYDYRIICVLFGVEFVSMA